MMKRKILKKKMDVKKKKPKKLKKNLAEVSTDEFFDNDFEPKENEDSEVENGNAGESGSDDSDLDVTSHKRGLKKLKDLDPEFYQFLQKNDKKLLEFGLSEDEGDDDLSDKDVDEDENKHELNDNLEVASDDSEYENDAMEVDENTQRSVEITLKTLKNWQSELESDKYIKTIKRLIEAFHAACIMISNADGSDNSSHYRVKDSAVFNKVVQMCILNLPTVLRKYLHINADTEIGQTKLKRFPKIKTILKTYFKDLLLILESITSQDILAVLLKHLHQLIPLVQLYSSLRKPLLRILLKLWCTGEESVRVIAFLNIHKMATSKKESILETLLKTMYIKYVENSKFVLPSTLAAINFMRNSLVEIYMLDQDLAYNHAFLYIRQLAIHLRNAIVLKKKEHFQAVYNWQFINSLRFWSTLICLSNNGTMLQSLLYPLVQIIVGAINLIPTAQFYPLRFHCIQLLITLSKETGTLIPILPHLLHILNTYDFNKKHKTVSMKPMSFICILRVSRSQLRENGFKDSVIENIYQLMLENAAKDSHLISFPDMHIPCIVQLKAFLKKCKVANFGRKMKQLLDKIQENYHFIENERKKITIDLHDLATIKNWENKIRYHETPLMKFYKAWFEIHQSQKLKLITRNDDEEFSLKIRRKNTKQMQANDDDNEDMGVDDDDDDVDEGEEDTENVNAKAVEKKKAKLKKKESRKQKIPHQTKDSNDDSAKNDADIVKNASVDDWN